MMTKQGSNKHDHGPADEVAAAVLAFFQSTVLVGRLEPCAHNNFLLLETEVFLGYLVHRALPRFCICDMYEFFPAAAAASCRRRRHLRANQTLYL